MPVLKMGKTGKWRNVHPKAGAIICPVAEAQALLKLIKREELWRSKNAGLFPCYLTVREFGG